MSNITEYKKPDLILTDMSTTYIDIGDTRRNDSFTYSEWNQLQLSLYDKENPITMWILLRKKSTMSQLNEKDVNINIYCQSESEVKLNIPANNRHVPDKCIESWFSDEALQLIFDNNLESFTSTEELVDSIHILFSKLTTIDAVINELCRINGNNLSIINKFELICNKNPDFIIPSIKIINNIDNNEFILIPVYPKWVDGHKGGTRLGFNFGFMPPLSNLELENSLFEQMQDERCLAEREYTHVLHKTSLVDSSNLVEITNYPILRGGDFNNKYKKIIKKINKMNYLAKIIFKNHIDLLKKDYYILPSQKGYEMMWNSNKQTIQNFELKRTKNEDFEFYKLYIKKPSKSLIQLNYFINPYNMLLISWNLEFITSVLYIYKYQIKKIILIVINNNSILDFLALKENYLNLIDIYFLGNEINSNVLKNINIILEDHKFDTIYIDLGYTLLNNDIFSFNTLILSYLIVNKYLLENGILIIYNLLYELHEKQNILLSLINDNFRNIHQFNKYSIIYNCNLKYIYIFQNYKSINNKIYLLFEKLLKNLSQSINLNEYYKHLNLFTDKYEYSKSYIDFIIYNFKFYYAYNKFNLKKIIKKYNLKIDKYNTLTRKHI